MLRNLLFVLLLSVSQISLSQWLQTGSIIEGEVFDGSFGQEVVISDDGLTLAVADPLRFSIDDPNPIRIFKRQGLEWIETNKIFNDDPNGIFEGDNLGLSMSFSDNGNILAVGIPRNSFNTDPVSVGRVKIYKNIQGNWEQIGSDIINSISGQLFGSVISMSADGSIIAIGNTDSGITQVYKNNNDNWEQLGQNIGTGIPDDFFGESLSLSNDGKVLAIGIAEARPFNLMRPGRIRVYKFENNNWEQQGGPILGTSPSGGFGASTKLSGDGKTLIASAISINNNDLPSYVEVYKYLNNQWTKTGNTLTNCEICIVSEFGADLGITDDGSLIAISDPYPIEDKGGQTLSFYNLQSNTWTLLQQIAISNPSEPEQFGRSISFNANGSIIVAGSPLYKIASDNFNYYGAVRTYENSNLLSIDENTFDTNLLLHPNPFFNNITVDFKEIQKSLNVTILDIQGRKIKSLDFYNKSTIEINLEVSAGTYFIKVKNDKANTKTFKVIKQ